MGKLIVNELAKIFRRTGTLVMIGLIVIFVLGLGGVKKYDEYKNPPQENPQWKQELETQLAKDREALNQTGENNANLKMYYERQIAITEYQVEQEVAPISEHHVWSFVRDAEGVISFVGLFTIIIAASIVSSEFSWGTIKLLLVRPISRSKILLSKYITILLFGGLLLAILYIVSSIVGLIMFGLQESATSHLAFSNGEVVERNIFVQLVGEYLISSIDVFMVATMAFMISVVFRNGSLAIGISLFLLFMGGTGTMLLAGKFEWAKYILFANTDLSVYFDGIPPVDGMTLAFSVLMLLVYFVIFQILAFWVFSKRDVSA